MNRAIAIAVSAGALALAVPSAASAAYASTLENNTITMVGDGASDKLVLGSSGLAPDEVFLTHNQAQPGGDFNTALDFDSSKDGIQALNIHPGTPATTAFRVLAGEGNDLVQFATPDALATFEDNKVRLEGGGGDDTLLGTNSADTLLGGDGNDRLVPGRNPGATETQDGGAGNDVLVWNDGDNNDVIEGGDGADAVEVNGSDILGDAFTLNKSGARAAFARTNLGTFTLDAGKVERFVVNGAGGNDAITLGNFLSAAPDPVLATLNGGTGIDTITGGDGPDLITGGEGDDVLTGGGGDDAITGDRGNDTKNGGDGDDTLVWNNGDGTDDTVGDAGYDVTQVNAAPGPDVFTIKPLNGIARLDRTNVAPFGINIATEAVELNTLGGDDDITVLDGAPVVSRLDGGSGNDVLRGASGDDSLFGGGGNDTLVGGAGFDALDGSVGDDTILARDGQPDLVRCATGTDKVTLDAVGVDAQSGCETVDQTATAPPAPTAPGTATPGPTVLRIGRLGTIASTTTAKLVKGRYSVSLRVSCPTGGSSCRGDLALSAKQRSTVGATSTARLATATYSLKAGSRGTVALTFSRKTRALARGGVISASARSQSAAVDGVATSRTTALKIKLPKKA